MKGFIFVTAKSSNVRHCVQISKIIEIEELLDGTAYLIIQVTFSSNLKHSSSSGIFTSESFDEVIKKIEEASN